MQKLIDAFGDGLIDAVNRRDGSVEAVFAGKAQAVAEMIALCRHGPPGSRVEAVLNEPARPDELGLRRPGEAFSVLPTG